MALPTGEKLDLTKGESWTLSNEAVIAQNLGFELNDEFRSWLTGFIESTILPNPNLVSPVLANLAIKDARDHDLKWTPNLSSF